MPLPAASAVSGAMPATRATVSRVAMNLLHFAFNSCYLPHSAFYNSVNKHNLCDLHKKYAHTFYYTPPREKSKENPLSRQLL
jgi:hypothetical protein